EGHRAAALRQAAIAAFEHLAVFGALGLQHGLSLRRCLFRCRGRSRRRACRRLTTLDGRLRFELRGFEHLALEDPHLDADDAVGRMSLGEAVVDVGTEGVQRNAALAVPLSTRNLGSVQTARNAHFHAQRATAHRAHHGALHRATEHDTLLDLLRDAVGDQLRIQLGLADLGDVQPHVRHDHPEQLRRFLAQLLDVLALLADYDARTRGLDRDVDLLRGTLDLDAAHRSLGEALTQELAHPEVGMHVHRELLLPRVPARRPVAGDPKTYA